MTELQMDYMMTCMETFDEEDVEQGCQGANKQI